MKINLGCGDKIIPEFINVDKRRLEGVDIVADASWLPFENDSIDLIYASHMLEHFRDTNKILTHWYKKLKKGGVLRLGVPDFESLVRVYKEHGDMSLIEGPLVGGHKDMYDKHHRVFDFNSLKRELINAGFKDIRKWDWRKTEHSQYDDYTQAYIPHMDKENGILISLNVEATK